MGLDIGVGWRARHAREMDEDELADFGEAYVQLNEVLAEAGLPAHHEPLGIPEDQVFEAQMWGYSGLHTVRRLAAYQAIKGRLPEPGGNEEEAAHDPVLEALYQAHDRHWTKRQRRPPKQGFLSRLFSASPLVDVKPDYQHLLWHSDCEGFYVPLAFDDVILDSAQPQREGLGGMVGSTGALLQECLRLAEFIDLPTDMDPESEELFEAIEARSTEGERWRSYPVEAFCLARLIRACELSLRHKAVVIFG